jgi:nicotinate-nucleotide adenylyltransferase
MELRREGKSYTYETVEQLRTLHPDAELVLLMGTDMFLTFHQWRCPERILSQAALGVFYRGERGEETAVAARKAEMEAAGHKVYLVENDVVDISSTDLRRMLIFRCADPFLPKGVGDYIRVNNLYSAGRDYKKLPMEELEKVVISLLKPSRVSHVLGCRDTAVELAKRWGADETDAARAGMLHDVTKALDGPLQLTLCAEYGTMLDDFGKKYPKTLHALTGALVAQRIFGENEAVVNAIRHHTTGKADMALLEKIIYVADYMEPNRDFPGVEQLRSLAFIDLDGALKLGLEMTLEHLKRQGSEVSPESRDALAFLCKK